MKDNIECDITTSKQANLFFFLFPVKCEVYVSRKIPSKKTVS